MRSTVLDLKPVGTFTLHCKLCRVKDKMCYNTKG